MDIVTILRDLWRLRRYVAVVLALAVVAAAGIKFMLPSYRVGVASAQILVDTPSSQVVNVSPRGSDTTAARADLLASLMVDGQVKADIAQRAGVSPSRLVGTTSAATDPTGSTVTAPSGPQAYVLNTQVLTNSTGDELPIIEIDTQAPTRAEATKLANAAVAGLDAYLNTKAAAERVADANRLQVSGLGLPVSTVQAKGTSPVIVVLIFVFVLLAGCGTILGIRGIVSGWRAASVREQTGDQPLPGRVAEAEAIDETERVAVWMDETPDPIDSVDDAQASGGESGDEPAPVHDGDPEQIASPPPQGWLVPERESSADWEDAYDDDGYERLPRLVRRRGFGSRGDRDSEQEVA